MAVNPREPERNQDTMESEGRMRPVRSMATPPARKSRTRLIVLAIGVLIVIAVVAYFALYGGSSGGGSGGGGGGIGGYLVFALSSEQLQRIRRRLVGR